MRNMVPMRLSMIALAALAALSAHAVVLGNVRNAVYVGKAFNANIELSDYQTQSLCISTELSYGDSRISGTTHTLKGTTLRVRNTTPIYEPIVTLMVTADCANPVTRKYTLFAEAPMVMAPAELEDEAETSDNSSAKATRRRQDTDNFFGVAGGPTLGSESVPVIARVKPPKRKVRAPAQARPTAKRSLGSYGSASISSPNTESSLAADSATPQIEADSRPRLELGNFDWTLSDPGLRASPELLSLGAETDPSAREIARARWAALSAQMDGLANDATLHATQQDFLSLTEQIKTRDQQIATLRAQLVAQENAGLKWRDVLPWLLGLLLLGAAALLTQRWRKARARTQRKNERQKEVWWQHEDGLVDQSEATNEGPTRQTSGAGAANNRATRFTEQMPVPEVQDLDKASASQEFPEFFVSGLDEAALFIGSNQARQATEVLLDTQQQVDFFLALGQYDKAIDILKNHINENAETSPLVYLDLLNVYNIAGRESSFEELRQNFNQLFNANVPDFANYRVNSRGLETYGNVIARIQTHWNTPKVINLIEESVFRRPGETSEEAFDPLAYRELLMLYGIAIETNETESNLYRLKSQQSEALSAAPAASASSIDFTADGIDMPEFSSTIPVSDFHIEDEGNTALSPLSAAEPSFSAFAPTQAGNDSLVDLDLGAAHSGESLDFDLGLALGDDSAVDFDLSQSAPLEGMSITMGSDLDFSLDDELTTPTPKIKRGHQAKK